MYDLNDLKRKISGLVEVKRLGYMELKDRYEQVDALTTIWASPMKEGNVKEAFMVYDEDDVMGISASLNGPDQKSWTVIIYSAY